MTERFCTQCGAKVGTPHHRTGSFIWKRSQRVKDMQDALKQAKLAELKKGAGGGG